MSDSPKLDIAIDYLLEHYPDDAERLASNKLIVAAIILPDFSNPQIEDLIDKVAIFNGIKKKAVRDDEQI